LWLPPLWAGPILGFLCGSGLDPGPVLVFVDTRGFVCNIPSLMSSTYYVLSFEVGGLGRYVFLLDWLYT